MFCNFRSAAGSCSNNVSVSPRDSTTIELRDGLASALPQAPQADGFDSIMQLEGEVFRRHKSRETIRIELGDRAYFLKKHRGVGWKEILKNVLRGRQPTVSAVPELRAIERLHALNIPTMTIAGWGVRGRNPAAMESFIITDELSGMIHLDELIPRIKAMNQARAAGIRRVFADTLGRLSRTLHEGGVNHRDFYLCHFMIDPEDGVFANGTPPDLHVIDLHRAQLRQRTPRRWRSKDLIGLLFSSYDAGLSGRLVLRFLRAYWGSGWKTRVRRSRLYLRYLEHRARMLYRSHYGTVPPRPG